MGAVRSKNSSMASAGTLQPIVERGLRRLQYASMNSITACLAESLVGKLRLQCLSFLSVAKNDSATALPRQLPVRLSRQAHVVGARPFRQKPASVLGAVIATKLTSA